MIEPLTHAALDGTAHGFFTRQGGVSTGLYDSLNTGLGSDDARACVLENRDRVRQYLGATALATACLLYTSPSPRDLSTSRMPSSA